MATYIISNFDVDDAEAFAEYQKLAAPVLGLGDAVQLIAHDYQTEQYEGEGAGRLTIILKAESAEAAHALIQSDEYQQISEQRLRATSNHFSLIVEGM